ncbi:replication initiator protein [Microviridae sp.]|nr:replication initiator protein [Microviridae sp.]
MKSIPVPCGKCPPCKSRRVNSWIFRLQQENLVSTSAYFITLTYATDHVPILPTGPPLTLRKSDYQKFMKRLRKRNESTIKYYACGEYGTKSFRPHYHAIIFNVDYINHIFESWKLGDVHVGQVSEKSIAYTLKYIDKPQRIPLHMNDKRVPEFSLMSKGLGSNYIDKAAKYHKADPNNRLFLTRPDGIKLAMPKFYRDKLFNEYERRNQNSHIAKTVAERDREDRALFCKTNPRSREEVRTVANDFDLNRSSRRTARYSRFYKQQSNRNKI